MASVVCCEINRKCFFYPWLSKSSFCFCRGNAHCTDRSRASTCLLSCATGALCQWRCSPSFGGPHWLTVMDLESKASEPSGMCRLMIVQNTLHYLLNCLLDFFAQLIQKSTITTIFALWDCLDSQDPQREQWLSEGGSWPLHCQRM